MTSWEELRGGNKSSTPNGYYPGLSVLSTSSVSNKVGTNISFPKDMQDHTLGKERRVSLSVSGQRSNPQGEEAVAGVKRQSPG